MAKYSESCTLIFRGSCQIRFLKIKFLIVQRLIHKATRNHVALNEIFQLKFFNYLEKQSIHVEEMQMLLISKTEKFQK